MPRSGPEAPTSLEDTAVQLRAKAAHTRRLARDFQGDEHRLMLEFADELEARASDLDAPGRGRPTRG